MAGLKGAGAAQFSALQGFPKMNVQELRPLFREFAVDGRMPTCEVSLVSALVRHFVPGAAEDDIRAALRRRGQVSSILSDDKPTTLAGADKMMTMLIDELDDEGIKEEVCRLQNACQVEARRRAKQHEDLDKHFAAKTYSSTAVCSAASSSSAARVDRRAPIRIPVLEQGYSVAEATQWLPPECKLHKESQWHRRWRVESSLLHGVRSKSVGGKTGLTDTQSLFFVLATAWHAHTDASGEPCPWDFEV